MVEFKDYEVIANEIIKSIIAREDANANIKHKEEEYEIQSIMMLINEESHHIGQKMLDKFRRIDEDEHGYVKLSDVKRVLEEINAESIEVVPEEVKPPAVEKEVSEKYKPKVKKNPPPKEPLLSVIEISEFTRKLSEKYEFNKVKYDGLQRELIEFKLGVLKKGLLESNLNNL